MKKTMWEILYREDDYYNLLAMRYAFEKKLPHLKLLESVTVEEGIEIARRQRPCLVLTDLKFAGMDGYQGLQELRRLPLTRDIPVWALSAYLPDKSMWLRERAGFDECFAKPIEMKVFLKQLGSFIGGLSALREDARAPRQSEKW
ncbi:response regulator [Saccharibacillus qingshengii]|uniref:response regulator n=1 Tax=Saccharibacillus qingshengii TaxID=1763540 RepID=UPI001556B4A6|nr:response regulator [Saccharibacillus qingshengii]